MILPNVREAALWYTVPEKIAKQKAKNLLSKEEQAYLSQITHPTAAALYLGAHAMLRDVLGRYLQQDPTSLVLVSDEHGKPRLRDHALSFNLSHTEGLAVLLVHQSVPVGVDVEFVFRKTRYLQIAARYFSAAEKHDLASLSEEASQRALFFRIWTLKEAYLKARGFGLQLPLDAFSFRVSENSLVFAPDATLQDDASQWQFSLQSHGREHQIATAIQSRAEIEILSHPWHVV